MSQDAINNVLVLDARDDSDRSTAAAMVAFAETCKDGAIDTKSRFLSV